MKKVIIHPERCVGCLQCMLACAVAHSASRNLAGALQEEPRPRPRIHVGVTPSGRGFPNRCRHCDPAPCMAACLPGAIFRDPTTATVLIDPDRCIACASCAMACPFGVLRFHPTFQAPPGKEVAVKCDNCDQRQAQGLPPACVEACLTRALTFEEPDQALKRQTDRISRLVLEAVPSAEDLPASLSLLRALKQATAEMNRRGSGPSANPGV